MAAEYQKLAAIQHCKLIYGYKKDKGPNPSTNSVKEYWRKKQKGRSHPDMNLGGMEKGTRVMSAYSLKLLENTYDGVVDVFFYGPYQTLLWLALSNSPDSRETLYDLAKVLGTSAQNVENLTDDELYTLAQYFDGCALHVFAYSVYRFQLVLSKENLTLEQLTGSSTSLDIFFSLGDIKYFLGLYNLDREFILQLIAESDWYDGKNRPERVYPPRESLYVKNKAYDVPLGVYVPIAVERFLENGVSPITDPEFFENELKDIEIIWK